jgi:signal transduction histidine kinase
MHPSENGVRDITGEAIAPHLWAQANHDLRQPVQALFFMARSLARTVDDAGARETITYMDAALQGLQAKLDLLTELSRIESGTKVPELRPCALLEICQELLPSLTALAAKHGVALRSRLRTATVKSDAVLLTLLVRSMILNALKLTNHGDILMGSRRRADSVNVELYFRGALGDAQRKSAFVQLSQKNGPASELGLGLGFISCLARRLNHTLAFRPLMQNGVCLALALPAAH